MYATDRLQAGAPLWVRAGDVILCDESMPLTRITALPDAAHLVFPFAGFGVNVGILGALQCAIVEWKKRVG